MIPYSKQWSTATPGYLIFLIDQSGSMSNIWDNQRKKSDYTAEVVNQTINELIATNAAGETVKDRVFISLIGYGGNSEVKNLSSDYLSKYADNPEVKTITKQVSDGMGGYVNMNVELPLFLKAKAEGATPMAGAFDLAKRLILGWIEKKKDYPVPIIINVSDGIPENPIGSPEPETRRTIEIANQIMKIESSDGNPLIFNVHISSSGNETQFPENQYELNGDPYAEFLFKISSVVPPIYKKAAKDFNLNRIRDNSRGLISNASSKTFVAFINFGSSAGSIRASI